MGKFSPFGLLFPISLSSPIFGFVGDFIDSEKTTVIKFKSAKWNDIHKFNERNPEDLSMGPGKLVKAWLYAKGGEIYEDGFFRRMGKLSDLGDESSEKLANLFEASVGYQVIQAEGSVINAEGIENVNWNGSNGKVEPRSSTPSVRWSELRRVGTGKKLERKLNMRRVSFARVQGGHLNALLNDGGVAKDNKLITLAGVVVNAFGTGNDVEEWKKCRNGSQVVSKSGSCNGILDAIKKVVSLEKITSGDGVATLKLDGSNGMEKCQDGTKDWFADRSKKCILNGFLTHSDLTFRIEQELE